MLDRRVLLSRWWHVDGRTKFDPHRAFKSILDATIKNASECILEGDYITAVVVTDEGSSSRPSKLQILALRTADDSPAAFSPGRPLTSITLPSGFYTADVSHVMIWPDGTAGQIFHASAPRLTGLAYYLRKKTNEHVIFESLYNKKVVDRLKDISGKFRSIDIALTTPERGEQVDQGVFGTLVPAIWGKRVPSISVKLSMGRYGKRDMYLDSEMQEQALQIAETASEYVDRMILRGKSRESGRMVELNLLSERLGEDVKVQEAPESISLPDDTDAFGKIEEVYGRAADAGALADAVQATAVRGN